MRCDHPGQTVCLLPRSLEQHSFTECMLNCFSCVRLFVTLWTVARQASLSMGFSRQEYWRGCHALLQEIFLTQGSNSPLFRLLHWLAGSLSTEPPGKQSPPPCSFSLSNTNYLPKATSSNTITLGIRVSICELQQGRGHEVGNKNSVHSKYLHISYTFIELV